ncbi:capsular polysaccharide synthesis protein [Limosilactobacillus reuteri]|nr:capsular polysaccharide synthesis protein [Limosilactobacillus reuteri]
MYNKATFFLSKVLKRLPVNEKIEIKFNSYRHHKINAYLNTYFEFAYNKILNKEKNLEEGKNEGPIWIFWWQGIDNMPEIVRYCFNSVKKNAGSRKVILIDEENYLKYSNLPPRIIKLFQEKKISTAHFSDVLRFNLLKNHGGLWLDATVFVSNKIDDSYFKGLYTCSGLNNPGNFFITEGKWCIFIFGGPKELPLFKYMCLFYENYFKYNSSVVDYFMTDYALNYAWKKNISNFEQYTTTNNNNPNLYALIRLLNERFDRKEWDYISKKTNMYKLSYKKRVKEDNGTYYDVIVKEKGK